MTKRDTFCVLRKETQEEMMMQGEIPQDQSGDVEMCVFKISYEADGRCVCVNCNANVCGEGCESRSLLFSKGCVVCSGALEEYIQRGIFGQYLSCFFNCETPVSSSSCPSPTTKDDSITIDDLNATYARSPHPAYLEFVDLVRFPTGGDDGDHQLITYSSTVPMLSPLSASVTTSNNNNNSKIASSSSNARPSMSSMKEFFGAIKVFNGQGGLLDAECNGEYLEGETDQYAKASVLNDPTSCEPTTITGSDDDDDDVDNGDDGKDNYEYPGFDDPNDLDGAKECEKYDYQRDREAEEIRERRTREVEYRREGQVNDRYSYNRPYYNKGYYKNYDYRNSREGYPSYAYRRNYYNNNNSG